MESQHIPLLLFLLAQVIIFEEVRLMVFVNSFILRWISFMKSGMNIVLV
jgi:hypothetical protein